VHEIARQHRENVRGLLRAKAIELAAAEPALGALAIEDLTDMYLLLFEGAIATAVAYRQPWPVEKARDTIERQLASSRPAA